MDILNFIGRLHPLVVHLPIGFLFLAILIEWFIRKGNSKPQQKITFFILILGALSAMLASLFGWLLADSEGYSGDTLLWHRWLGIGTCVLALIAPLIKLYSQKKLYHIILVSLGLLLFATGHYGGSLTHGSDYLLQPFQSKNNELNKFTTEQNPDSLLVYSHLIQPILEKKCYQCHNQEKDYGGLDMTSFKKLLDGGDHGTVINPDPWASELFKRVTMSTDNKLFMPPKGTPLSYNEIAILKWWIEQGADSSKTITEMEPDHTVKHILASKYKIDTSPKTIVERLKVKPIDTNVLDLLVEAGWQINQIAEDNHLLDVSPGNTNDLLNPDLAVLEKLKDHITWLNLSGMSLTDADIKIISQCKYLTRLQLENNAISGNGLAELSNLQYLESLNLNNNPLTFEKFDWINSLTSLKRLYLWQTNINPDIANSIQTKLPQVQLIF